MIVWTICQFLQMLGVVLMIFVLFDYVGVKWKEGIEKSRQAPRRRVEMRTQSEFPAANFRFPVVER